MFGQLYQIVVCIERNDNCCTLVKMQQPPPRVPVYLANDTAPSSLIKIRRTCELIYCCTDSRRTSSSCTLPAHVYWITVTNSRPDYSRPKCVWFLHRLIHRSGVLIIPNVSSCVLNSQSVFLQNSC